jgi:23S rRNA pseudouridine1911/1915/1917 synthase
MYITSFLLTYKNMKKKATIYRVDSSHNNYRIDLFLSLIMNISRNEVISLLEKQLVFINQRCEIKKSKKVFENDVIEILNDNNPIIKKDIELIPITVLFIHQEFLIIVKPPFISCHKASTKDTDYTIADFARSYWLDDADLESRFGIVHRLDKETSGILILARTLEARNVFIDLFKKRKIEKKYIAFIEKGLTEKSGKIEYSIMRDPLCPVKMTYSFGQGKTAQTNYVMISQKKEFDIIECYPTTGRTHQIRVHFQALKVPLLGDKVYGKESKLINRHALHAHQISFIYKDINYSFSTPLWSDMEDLKNS